MLPQVAAARGLVRFLLLAVGRCSTMCLSAVSVGLLLRAMAMVAFGLAVITFTMVSMGLEKCARHLPPVLFAGRGKQNGYGKDCGGNTGLHVGPSP